MRYWICPSRGARRLAQVELERALELVARIGVAPLERRRHAGAKVELRVPGIGGQRLAKTGRGGMRLASVERGPGGPFDQRAARIDLRGEDHAEEDGCERQQPAGAHRDLPHHDTVFS
jgi:hypothetical protein